VAYNRFFIIIISFPALLHSYHSSEAQEATAPLTSTTTPPAAKDRDEPAKSVALLAEELKRAPVKPSLAEGKVGLYLIDSAGGEATLIASEPEAWLCQCGSPSWSADGKQIALDATPGSADFSQSRIKVIAQSDGHLELRDLGPGNCPSFSPKSDQVVFLLNQGAVPGASPGVWLERGDGSGRTLLGGYGRPRWSNDSRLFMIASFGTPCELTLIDAREGHGGDVNLDGKRFFTAPSWAGEETVVGVIGETSAESIALVDLSSPGKATVKEVLWKAADTEIVPSSPVYSRVTGRCVFIGKTEGKGRALYAVDRGQKGPAKRLEPEGFDNLIQDPAMSPDGKYVVFSSDRNQSLKVEGMRAASIEAPAISGITIDGDLKDWPPAMERHAIGNLHMFPTANGHGGLQNAFMTTSPDLSAAMSVGWDPKEQVIYLGVIVRDDELIVGNTSPWDSDAIEIYVDGLRSNKSLGFPQAADFGDNFDVAEAPLLQYIGLPGKGPVYGVVKSAGVDRDPEENPILSWGDIKKTKTKMAFKRVGDVTTYEWAIQAFDRYPDKPTKLVPGLRVGFDVVVTDKDKPAQTPKAANDPEEDRAAWITWGNSKSAAFRPLDSSCLGELVLGRVPKR
jgi:hypothetical protein